MQKKEIKHSPNRTASRSGRRSRSSAAAPWPHRSSPVALRCKSAPLELLCVAQRRNADGHRPDSKRYRKSSVGHRHAAEGQERKQPPGPGRAPRAPQGWAGTGGRG